ncbi:tetratricopeptide repeat protein [Kineobactrum salinum]|uniref:hypothetical protein n=1 Tax=Kineobactrum salinum TaxID=2708301 RepID=UPI0018D7406F|nr:hypothetical protein [Kineobactrum salinum]
MPWRWVGVLHEYLDAGQLVEQPRLPGFRIEVSSDGARSADPHKFEKDAALLKAALVDEPDNNRYRFYLAQSYRDAGQLSLARENYRQRAQRGGWEEEVWYSLYQVACLTQLLEDSHADIVAAYLQAYQYRPVRAEPLAALAAYLRGRNEWHLAYLFATAAAQLPVPQDRLFVELPVYQWRALDELALAAFYSSRQTQAAQLWRELLQNPQLPKNDRTRIEANLGFVEIDTD